MNIDLSKLTFSDTLFRDLCRGMHVSEHQPAQYQSLDTHFEAYRALYRAVGFTLVRDHDQFFYFDNLNPTRTKSKNSQTYAVLIWALYDMQADKGYDAETALFVYGFGNPELDELLTRSADILHSHDIEARHQLRAQFANMASQGFAEERDHRYVLLPPARRFLRPIAAIVGQLRAEEAEHDA
jgi:hypothetical protein